MNEIEWKCTCGACPEQYDIYYNGRLAAYFRCRYGVVSVKLYDKYGSITDILLYYEQLDDEWAGSLDHDKLDQIKIKVNYMLDRLFW